MVDRDYMRRDFEGGGARSPFWATIPGTKGLIIGMVAIHVLTEFIRAADLDFWRSMMAVLRLVPASVLRGYVWQLVTAGVIHAEGDIWHIGVNMLMLWWFGRMVEPRLGLRRYLFFCLGATVTASLGYLLWAVALVQVTPMLGASGMVMGVIILAALWYPTRTILFFFVLRMQLWVLAAIYVVIDLLGAMSTRGGIAHSAHLGGALFGWIHFRYSGGFERVFAAIDRYGDRKRQEKEQRRRREEANLRREVDRILDKVNRDGMAALSDEERAFLKRASSRLRS